MLLSSLGGETDAALFGAVVAGDVLDDGAPVGCEVLAMALELHRLGADVAAGLEACRPAAPRVELDERGAGEELDAAHAEWAELRPRVLRGCAMIDALALVGEATRAEAAARRAMERALERHGAARAAGARTAELMREVLRG